MSLYPLTFRPILKTKIWGGEKLNEFKTLSTAIDNLGESWELSSVPGEVSIVTNGLYEGASLNSIIEKHKKDLLGSRVVNRYGNDFPLLIKFIHAKTDLSVQVHPDDEMAKREHNSFGKTEMWYILDTEPDAELLLGLKDGVDRGAFAKAIDQKQVMPLLNREKVTAGDSFFIPPGLVHAIGGGNLLAEIQQTSDITYRVYDYDRKDKKGELRELHVEKSLQAIDFDLNNNCKLNHKKDAEGSQVLADCEYFKTNVVRKHGNHQIELKSDDTFTIIINCGDPFSISWQNEQFKVGRGQTYLIPACIDDAEIQTNGLAHYLSVTA
jgi:mannose-6-phosphate isomerase